MLNEIKLQEEKIKEYEEMLDRYGRGRWYWSFRRNLDDMKDELKKLQNENVQEKFSPSNEDQAQTSPSNQNISKQDTSKNISPKK